MTSSSDDCYFFYYSTCSKGDACPFRHCAEALGSETTCKNWAQGHCFRPDTCMFRHMEIKKDRAQIHCYWETQPGGCKKMHCAFKHVNRATGDAGSKLPDPVSSSTPDATITKKILPQLDQDVSTPSPKIDPIVFNPFEEDSDRESVGVCTPKKSVSKVVTLPPAKTGKIKLTKPEPEENEGLGFEIKSLDKLKSEKMAQAKKILCEADKLVTSQSTAEEDDDDDDETPAPDTTSTSSSPGRVSAINRLGGSVTSKHPAQSTNASRRKEHTVQPATVRRVIQSGANSEEDSDTASVEEQPSQKRIAVLKEAEKPVSRRINLNKGRRIIIADDEVKAEKPPTRRVSPKKGGVLSRIGSRPDSSTKGDVRSRIGTKSETGQAVKKGAIQSRLGHRNIAPTDATSLEELPGSDMRTLELEKAKLTARLMHLEEMSDSSEDQGLEEDQEEESGDTGVKSLEDIQREKALQSMKQNRLKKAQTQVKPVAPPRVEVERPSGRVARSGGESRTSVVARLSGRLGRSEVERPRVEVARSSGEERPTGAGKKRVLTTRKSSKQAQQIYKPPGAKLKQAEEPAPSSLRDRLGKRKVTPEKLSPSNKRESSNRKEPSNKKEQADNTENVPQKKSSWAGWGVKTFSEIMREKQQQGLSGRSTSNRSNSEETEDSESSNRRNGKKFTPVVFDDNDRSATEKTTKVTITAKRKFTPVVFDVSDNKEEKASRPTSKKFKPIMFDDDDEKEVSPPSKKPQSVIQKIVPQEKLDKTSPSPRRQLSRQQSNKSVAQETTPPTGTVRKLKRRSSSQISEADSATVKTRRRSSGASRKSSVGEKAAPAPQEDDSLDLLDDEFGDLLGDVDVNDSALQAHNDDDLLQEMEELLA